MTGFASLTVPTPWGTLHWEARSVNNRYLDCKFKLPDFLRELEFELLEYVKKKIGRGRIDCYLKLEFNSNAANSLSINQELATALITVHKSLSEKTGDKNALNAYDLMRWPNVLETELLRVDQIKPELMSALNKLLNELIEQRQHEGQKLKAIVSEKLHALSKHLDFVNSQSMNQSSQIRDKLTELIKEQNIQVESQRLEQELIFYLNKLDIKEECDRLAAHIDKFEQTLTANKPMGKSLDFLLQEMNREINTIASKCSNVSVSHSAVDMKVLVEQMREQIQNIQ